LKIFLTGASGFVGSHLARLLVRAGHEVHALLRPGASVERIGDILDRLAVVEGDLKRQDEWFARIDRGRPEVWVHLAWIATPGVYLKSPENTEYVAASLQLAKRLAETGCRRFVAAGTCFEYAPSTTALSESAPTGPRTIYAASKLEFEVSIERLAASWGVHFVWPRLFYLYGPGEHEKRLVPVLIRSLLRNEIAKLASGDRVFDYLHVEDVAAGIWAAAQSDLRGPVNIASGRPVTLRDLAEEVERQIGVAGLLAFDAYASDPIDLAHVLGDNRRLLSTGWKPRYTLQEGIRQTIEWWKNRMRAN